MTWRRSGDKYHICHCMLHSDARCTNQNSFVVLCSSNLFRFMKHIWILTVIRQSVIIDGLAPDPDQASIFVNSDLYQVIENISKNETVIFRANMHLVGDEDTILVWAEMKLQKQCNRQLKFRLDMLPDKYALRVDYIGSPWKVHMHDTF